MITKYHWPGNVRELRNVIERAMILTDNEFITPQHLPFEIKKTKEIDPSEIISEVSEMAEEMSLDYAEKIHLKKVLKKLDWNKSKASKALGISRATLRSKINKYQLIEK